MLNIATILKTFSQNQKNIPEITAFANWLMQNCESEDFFTNDLLEKFFREALVYPHWSQNKNALNESILSFLSKLALQLGERLNLEQVQSAQNIQVIEIDSLPNWVDVVNSYLTQQHKSGEKFRIIYDDHLNYLFAIILYPNRDLKIRQFDKKMTIQNGFLIPLRDDLELNFDEGFELKENFIQKIEIGPFMMARFITQNMQNFGLVSRGYLFQKYQSLNSEPLVTFPKLFYSLKRIEQHFIKRESDPFYNDLIESLEHGIRMIRLGDENFIENAPDLMAKAQNAHDYVFIGDKLLSLLIRDLQYTMAGKKNLELTFEKTQPEKASWNQNLTQETLDSNQNLSQRIMDLKIQNGPNPKDLKSQTDSKRSQTRINNHNSAPISPLYNQFKRESDLTN